MPDFGTPFAGAANSRKLTRSELIRAIRFAISAEYEAVQLYLQIAEATDDKVASAVLKSVANEEIVHAGEFLRVLYEISPNEKELYDEGAAEVEKEIKGVS